MAGDDRLRPMTITKFETLLADQGCPVRYHTLNRFATQRCGFGCKDITVRVADGDSGVECQIDFGYLGCSPTPPTGGVARRTRAPITP
ncbi:hypothetical protein [Mycolicibacterium arenosum]|uniref:Uncharacterized protein n=1 Tax=Mycolicibacterium arenosum TaxID=2952157 RepID=A0ABT1LWD3_9MYCO|nr:hypothetical protein [Mycolicibacterium sp. CAU 1645]MCP9271201.1 hypothetical protein [Mycolicibacterium sp. CAU 1645]